MLKLQPFFDELQNEIYCIVKKPEHFPEYAIGSDLDIFCYDMPRIINTLTAVGSGLISGDREIKLTNNGKQAHVDFIAGGVIQFRFDLYAQLPTYTKVNVKSALFESIIENRMKAVTDSGVVFFTPSKTDEALIRYLEYHEWYGRRPDKIRHVDFIVSNLTQPEKELFLSKLHHYTELPGSLDDPDGRDGMYGPDLKEALKKIYNLLFGLARRTKHKMFR